MLARFAWQSLVRAKLQSSRQISLLFCAPAAPCKTGSRAPWLFVLRGVVEFLVHHAFGDQLLHVRQPRLASRLQILRASARTS